MGRINLRRVGRRAQSRVPRRRVVTRRAGTRAVRLPRYSLRWWSSARTSARPGSDTSSRSCIPPRLRSRSAADTVLLLALLGVTSALVFRFSGPFFYAVLPMLVVLALVCRQLGAALGGLIVALVAIWFTARGHGPFIGGTREGNL